MYDVEIRNNDGKTTTTFAIGLQPSVGAINLNTDSAKYYPGETVLISIESGPKTKLQILIHGPLGDVVEEILATTNQDGRLSASLHLPQDAKNGTWKIKATSGPNFDTAEFNVTDNLPNEYDYVKYDFTRNDKDVSFNFELPRILLSPDVKRSMWDYCNSTSDISKDEKFWDAMPIRILPTTSEFESLNGVMDSFVVDSYGTNETCPPHVWMRGTFASETGNEHDFQLICNGASFGYEIDGISLPVISSPLKQFKDGVAINEIQCRENFVLIQKYDDEPACVTSETKTKLIERGWTSNTLTSFCFMGHLPVCGVDGKTYGNLCLLNKSDVQLYHDGECTSYDPSHGNVIQPKKVIVEVVDRHYTEQVFPIRTTEVTSGITNKDKIQSWFFLPIDTGEKIRDWNFVTNSVFGIVDKNGDDAIDWSVNQDFGFLNDVSRGSQLTCSNDEIIYMKYRTPFIIEIKDNVTETYGIYSNIGFPPSLYKNETLKIASFFDQEIILPDHAILISNRSETCAVNHMGFTEAYYDEIVFQFTR